MPRILIKTWVSSLLTVGLLSSFAPGGIFRPLPVHAAALSGVKNSAPAGCEVYQGSFLDTTAPAMLKRLGVSFYSGDHISAFPDPAWGIGSSVTLCREFLYTKVDAGASTTAHSWTKTVSDFLNEQRVQIGASDEVTPPLTASLKTGDTISIVRVAQTQVNVSVTLPFATQYQDDATLEKGTTQVQQAGKNGVRTDTYTDTRKDGVVVSHVKISSQVVTQPVPKIVLRGTKVVVLGSGLASWYGGVKPMSAASVTLPLGTVITVTNTANGKSVTVIIADRGPFVDGRVLDLSKDAFAQIASVGSGVASVTYSKN